MAILLVKVADNNVPDAPGKWRAGQIVAAVEDDHVFGTAEEIAAGNFYHVKVTNRTASQVEAYLSEWRHNPTITQVANQGNNRRIRVESDMVSVSGKNAFIRADVEALFAALGGTYHSHGSNWFQFDIRATPAERDEIIEQINEAVQDMQYARRRWGITPAGMTYLSNNGGYIEAQAGVVANYLRDGLLD